MKLDTHSRSKLARVVRYGAVALIAAWSLMALAGYAVLGTLSGLMASLDPADGWIAWSGGLVGQAGGPIVVIVWLAGTLFILGAMALIRRFVT